MASNVPGTIPNDGEVDLLPAAPHPVNQTYVDIISTLSGADAIYAGPGNDVSVSGGAGNDWMFGGHGNDKMNGGAGNDRMYGGDGADALYGESGNDLLAGNAGNDILYGNVGHDVLIGGLDNDKLNGENDNDALFDGMLTITASNSIPPHLGNDNSTDVGDANDLAMQDLLSDWSDDNLLNGLIAAYMDGHEGSDELRGYVGGDGFSAGSASEIKDFGMGPDFLL
jgi:serralysin